MSDRPVCLRDQVESLEFDVQIWKAYAVSTGAALKRARDDLALARLPVYGKEAHMTEADFTRWFASNYPTNTLIGDPLWHSPRIYRRATGTVNAHLAPLADSAVLTDEDLDEIAAMIPDHMELRSAKRAFARLVIVALNQSDA